MIREVRLTSHKEAGNGAHQVVVYPETTHRVVDGWVDTHGHLVGVLASDLGIHVEEVTVALDDLRLPQALDTIGKVEVNTKPTGTYATALIADLLRIA